jgi:hypothetical protein
MKSFRERYNEKRAMRVELQLEREFREAMTYARIVRRLLQDHLGRTWYVNRIEIQINGEDFNLINGEYKDGCPNADKLRIEMTLKRINNHLNAGGYINLQHWKQVEFAWA